MPPQKNQAVHSHWNIEKWDIDPTKVFILPLQTNLEDPVLVQALRERVHGQRHLSQKTFGQMQNFSQDCFEGQERSRKSISASNQGA
jgi:hypothetical protein